MLTSALWRHVGNGAFDNFKERLLHAFARHVARYRHVFAFSCDFVDFVNVDYALFGASDVAVRSLNEFQKNVFDVFADVAGFRERRCVGNRKRHVKDIRKRSRKQSLAATGRSEQQYVAFVQNDVVAGFLLLPILL